METKTSYRSIIKISSQRFSVEDLSFYSLAIQVGNHDLQISAFDTRTRDLLSFEAYEFKNITSINARLKIIKSIVDEHAFLQAGFWKRVKIISKTHKFTIVPQEFYEKEFATHYLSVNNEVYLDREEVLSQQLPSNHCTDIYIADKKLHSFFINLYGNEKIDFYHQGGCFIELITNEVLTNHSKMVACLLDGNIFHIVVSDGENLLFYNQFAVRKTEDYLKYIMYVYNELSLKNASDSLTIWGNIKQESSAIGLLKKYFRHVHLGHRPANISFTYDFDEIDEWCFYELFGTHLLK